MLAATVIGAVLLDVLFLNNTAVGTSVGGSCRLELRTLRITQSQLASVALQEPPSGQTPTGPAGGEKDKDKSKKPSKDKSKKPPKNSPEGVRPGGSALLYDRLGKKEGITAVVNEFVSNVGADQRINKFFAKTDLDKLKMHLVNQICEASGGPCKYTGRSMKEAHQGMGVSGSDFNALVEDLLKALNKFNVGKTEQDELLGVLAGLKADIVEKP